MWPPKIAGRRIKVPLLKGHSELYFGEHTVRTPLEVLEIINEMR